MASPLILVVAGDKYEVDFDDFTPAEVGAFRNATGMPLRKVTSKDDTDLDLFAGVIWLIRRKLNPKLTYEEVASSFTWREFDVIPPTADDEGRAERAATAVAEDGLADPQP